MRTGQPLGFEAVEPVNRHGAFPRLDQDQMARLRMVGDIIKVSPVDILFQEGDDSYDFLAIESGAVTIVRGYGSEDRVIAVHEAGRFTGELNLLSGGRAYLTGVVRDTGTVIHIPRRRFLGFIRYQEDLANLVFGAF